MWRNGLACRFDVSSCECGGRLKADELVTDAVRAKQLIANRSSTVSARVSFDRRSHTVTKSALHDLIVAIGMVQLPVGCSSSDSGNEAAGARASLDFSYSFGRSWKLDARTQTAFSSHFHTQGPIDTSGLKALATAAALADYLEQTGLQSIVDDGALTPEVVRLDY